MDNVSPWVAFVGGLVSLVSPCTLPMVPVYFATLFGAEAFKTGAAGRRLTIFLHSLSFIIGFSIIFILLGTGAGFLGFSVSSNILLVRRISGSLMILFGLFMLASMRFSWLNWEKRLSPSGSTATGYLRSVLIGVLFAFAWTPCAGPVLGSILTLAFNSGSGGQGSGLLAFYSLGVALPFLISGNLCNSRRRLRLAGHKPGAQEENLLVTFRNIFFIQLY